MPFDTAARASAAVLVHARVLQASPLVLRLDGLDTAATRAPGCLVAPEPGDDVLALRTPGGCVLLQVIGRQEGAGAPVVLDHPAGIELRAPLLVLHAGQALTVSAPTAVLDGGSVTLRAAAAQVVARTAGIVADTLRTVAGRIETAASDLVQNAGNRTSVVTGVDTLDAHAAHTRVDTTSSLQAGTVLVLANTDIRMDAERISLG